MKKCTKNVLYLYTKCAKKRINAIYAVHQISKTRKIMYKIIAILAHKIRSYPHRPHTPGKGRLSTYWLEGATDRVPIRKRCPEEQHGKLKPFFRQPRQLQQQQAGGGAGGAGGVPNTPEVGLPRDDEDEEEGEEVGLPPRLEDAEEEEEGENDDGDEEGEEEDQELEGCSTHWRQGCHVMMTMRERKRRTRMIMIVMN